jgi:hypothetical protein
MSNNLTFLFLAQYFCFTDICSFTTISQRNSATHLVSMLSSLYQSFDLLCIEYACEKVDYILFFLFIFF